MIMENKVLLKVEETGFLLRALKGSKISLIFFLILVFILIFYGFSFFFLFWLLFTIAPFLQYFIHGNNYIYKIQVIDDEICVKWLHYYSKKQCKTNINNIKMRTEPFLNDSNRLVIDIYVNHRNKRIIVHEMKKEDRKLFENIVKDFNLIKFKA